MKSADHVGAQHCLDGCEVRIHGDRVFFVEEQLGGAVRRFHCASYQGAVDDDCSARCGESSEVFASDSPWFFGPNGFVLQGAQALPFMECRGQVGWFNVPTPAELERVPA